MTPAVRLCGIRKRYRAGWLGRRSVAALQGLSLEVGPAEIFGFLGANGAGKTSALRILMGLLHADEGTGSLLGSPLGTPALRSRVGYLPESFAFPPYWRLEDLLLYFCKLLGIPRVHRRSRLNAAIEALDLEGVRHRRVGLLSKGQAQRVGLAQCLLNDPDLLVLDEPTSGLDPMARRSFRLLLEALREKGRTVLLSSHILSDVEQICDRVAILHQGRAARTGTLDELLAGRSTLEDLFVECSAAQP